MVKIIVLIMLIFGLLQFAKEAPKMIMDLLGIKDGGTISAALKRGGVMASVTGGLLGTTASRFAQNYNADSNVGKGTLQRLASGFAGAGSGFARTLWNSRNVHNLKDATALRKKVSQDVTTARVNRSAYVHAHGGKFLSALEGRLNDNKNAITAAGRGYLGTRNEYEQKKEIDRVNSEYEALYKSEMESIWKNDSRWKEYNSNVKSAEDVLNSLPYGPHALNELTAFRKADGSQMTYGELQNYIKEQKSLVNNRKAELIKDNGDKVMEAAGKLNNFIDNHQGIAGVTMDRLDISQAIDASGDGQITFVDDVENKVKKTGFKPELDRLSGDNKYQTQRVQEKVQEDAREAARKAAEEANKK